MCRHCARRAVETLRGLPGVLAAAVRLSRETASVRYDERVTHEREIVLAMALRGYWLSPASGAPPAERAWFDAPRLGVVLALVGNLVALSLWKPARVAPKLVWIELVFALLLILVAAPPLMTRAAAFARKGIVSSELVALGAALVALMVGLSGFVLGNGTTVMTPNFLARFGDRPDATILVALETAGAIVGFAFLGHYVHQAFARRAFADIDRAVRGRYARVRRVTPREGDVVVPCAVLAPGDRIRLVAGEVAPLDMRLDVPARVAVPGGTIVDRASGQMLARGERLASPSVTGRIEHLGGMESSAAVDAVVQNTAARIEHDALRGEGGRFESVAALALFVAAIWFALFSCIVHALLLRGPIQPGVLLAGVAVLAGASSAGFVVGLPLARIIAVMRARSAGVVIKDAAALETLAGVDFAYFDKTGTLTAGAPYVVRLSWLRSAEPSMLSDVAALEAAATHPVGRAIARHLAAICVEPAVLDEPPVVRPNGVFGMVRGVLVEVSAAEPGESVPHDIRADTSVVCFRREGQTMGIFELSDPVRLDALQALRAMWHRGIACRILSGDSAASTIALGHRLGVPAAGNMGVADKARAVRALREAGGRVLHVSDGRPETARVIAADVIVAVAPNALPDSVAAPIVLRDPSLHSLVWLVDLARALRSRTRLLLTFALAYNAVIVPLCATGFVSPIAAAALSFGALLLICLLASRLMTNPRRWYVHDKLVRHPPAPFPTSTHGHSSAGKRQEFANSSRQ
ncbi:MAG: cation-translocating P-type ATPase [Polyangiaceae bacterium]|nr:cation-translocating P-type ATPase [Polyangiaceae bacterium]